MSQTSSGAQLAPESKTPKLVEPQTLFDRINRIHENIARRAFEIFESEGGLFGRELDQWFKAEAELLHPVHMTMTETDGALTVQAEVPGFNASELEVSIERRRLTISGKKETTKEEQKKGKVIYKEQCSSELLRIIDLPMEVDATKTTAMLKNGVLELNVPKGNAAKSARIDVKAA
ncbi:MAG: Hsp20 family protein [Candidatus Acidiferrales bacterium]